MRRLLLAASLLACTAVQASAEEPRAALLARGEAELQRGENAAALDDFERAAMMRHEADAEIGLIRAAMQDGQYRRALAFAAHTAGEHLESTPARLLYAQLLQVGGQAGLARRLLDDAPPGAAQALPRFAPWPSGAAMPAEARLVSNAVLLGDGAEALTPQLQADEVWVRNGLGQTRRARVDRGDPALQAAGLVRLHLEQALPGGPPQAARAPFAGSPGFVLQFAAGSSEAAWPQLSQGFLGAQAGDKRRLGFELPEPAPGAPVLDRQGRPAGIVIDAQSRWMPLPAGVMKTPDASGATGLIAPDEVYEAGLRVALQVLVVCPAATTTSSSPAGSGTASATSCR